MKIKSNKYSIITEWEIVGKEHFPIYNVLKETFIFNFSLFGEIINKQPFTDFEEAVEFIKTKS